MLFCLTAYCSAMHCLLLMCNCACSSGDVAAIVPDNCKLATWQIRLPASFHKQRNSSIMSVFTVRRYALHGICYRNSVCLSVCPSVWHTRGLCPHGSTYDHDFFTTGRTIIIVSGDITFIPKFEGGHPKRGRWMRVGWVRIGDFRPIRRRISETVRDTTKVTINH